MTKTEASGPGAATNGSIPLVSVIIPAYNAQDHLAECLSSVTAQAREFEIETIVVDDGSSDATPEIARSHPGVRYIRQDNAGPSAARNRGIAAARGEFIAFLDADDLWPPGKLKAQVRQLQDFPELGLVFGDCRQFDSQRQRPLTEFDANRLGVAAWGPGPHLPDAYVRLLEVNFITTGSVVVRRSALDAVGGFAEDLRLVEDLDLWLRIARRYPIAWCERECLLRRRHRSNISRDTEAMAWAYLEVLRRHTELWAADGLGTAGLDDGPLASRRFGFLAELAFAQGRYGVALSRLWRSLRASPRPSTLWRLTKLAARLVLRRHA